MSQNYVINVSLFSKLTEQNDPREEGTFSGKQLHYQDAVQKCILIVLLYLKFTSSSSRMRVIDHNWSATKQSPHPQSVAEISRHSVLSVQDSTM